MSEFVEVTRADGQKLMVNLDLVRVIADFSQPRILPGDNKLKTTIFFKKNDSIDVCETVSDLLDEDHEIEVET